MSEVPKEKNDKEVFNPKGREVNLSSLTVVVKPIVMKERDLILDLIGKILDDVSNNEDLKKGTNTGTAIKEILTSSSKELMGLYVKTLNKDIDWIENNLTIADEINLTKAIMEENQVPLLLSQIQAMFLKQI